MKRIFVMIIVVLMTGCASLQEQVAEKVILKVDGTTVTSSTINNADQLTAMPLQATVVAHLNNAADIAQAANDAPGIQCWATLSKWVSTLPLGKTETFTEPILPVATGPAGHMELARLKAKIVEQRVNMVKSRVAALRAVVDAGVPDEVVTACAVVVNDARSTAARVLSILGLVL